MSDALWRWLHRLAARLYDVRNFVLRPRVQCSGGPADATQLDALHHAAHERCFIANSVRCDIRVEAPAA